MDAKLIKDKYVNDFYYLMVGINTYATTHKESFKILSLKNCQAIELGYDLDELSRNYGNKDADITNDFGKGHREGCYMGYLAGFQKALEILGDKKYSEEDMLKSFSIGVFTEKEKGNHTFEYEEYIQSLQQAEWDVEIVEVRQRCHLSIGDWVSEDENNEFPMSINGAFGYRYIPKLDADGCLVLKRKI